jgi:hypothetical protein
VRGIFALKMLAYRVTISWQRFAYKVARALQRLVFRVAVF